MGKYIQKMEQMVIKVASNRDIKSYFYSNDNLSPLVVILGNHTSITTPEEEKLLQLLNQTFINMRFSVLQLPFYHDNESQESKVYVHNTEAMLGIIEDHNQKIDMVDIFTSIKFMDHIFHRVSSIWICGFGYGGVIATKMGMAYSCIDRFISISPIFCKKDITSLSNCICPGLIISNNKDNIINQNTNEAIKFMRTVKDVFIDKVTIDSPFHHMSGSRQILYQLLCQYISNTTPRKLWSKDELWDNYTPQSI